MNQPNSLPTAEEILSKHTGETGIYLTKGMIRGSDALEAMAEFTKPLLDKIDELESMSYTLTEIGYKQKLADLQSQLQLSEAKGNTLANHLTNIINLKDDSNNTQELFKVLQAIDESRSTVNNYKK